ncbi:MAG: DNA/RNA non-specific endonuclease [Bryobacterales bacterium]|nr:DNA/RNA non-specific endonuclease [Bryobacterales bacterium]
MNQKRKYQDTPPCPNCHRTDAAPAACPTCLLQGCDVCIARHAHCAGCLAVYNAFDPPPHAILGQDAWTNVCCAANGAQCQGCGEVYRTAFGAPHAYYGTDWLGQHCCAQNGGRCQGCGANYRNTAGAPHAYYGQNGAGQHCCAQNGARCQGCGAVYRNTDGPPHAYYGTNGMAQHCCAQNGARCQGCGVAYRNSDGSPHVYHGKDLGGLECCSGNGAVCACCGGPYRTGQAHAMLGKDTRDQNCCSGNGSACEGCKVPYRNSAGREHEYYGKDGGDNHVCAKNGGRCRGCGEPYLNDNGEPHLYLGKDKSDLHCCTGNGGQCPGCLVAYRTSDGPPHKYYGKDLKAQECCEANGLLCIGEGCHVPHRAMEDSPHAIVGTDKDGKQVCVGVGRICPACAKPALHANHADGKDLEEHAVCPDSGARCPHCLLWVCTVKCAPKHKMASTCHGEKCIRTVCAECEKCSVCGALTIDLCATCLADITVEDVEHLKVRHQLAPGQGAKVRRQLTITGSIKPKDVGNRKPPPPSLSSIEVDKDILEMKQFDRGHLVALELFGIDNKKNIVPMNYRFNRSGYWRTMEINIGKLISGTDREDVDGGTVEARPVTASTVGLSLGSKNTLNVKWRIEMWLFYDDVRGEPRVPVWFYVRVLRKKKLIAHFSMGNRCDKAATMPHADEVAEFAAAAALFRTLDAKALKRIKLGGWFKVDEDEELYDELVDGDLETIVPKDYRTSSNIKTLRKLHYDLSRYVVGDPLPGVPPNQLLQFMWDVNTASELQGLGLVFQTMEQGAQKESTSYDRFQREYLRAFNRWKNAGALKSDATAGLYVGERPDVWADLSECGGREAPEVDHVDPSYQSGENSYINARLVSFQHNHMYREKKTTGARPVDEVLLDLYRQRKAVLVTKTHVKYYERMQDFVAPRQYIPEGVKYLIPVTGDLSAMDVAAKLTALFKDEVILKGPPNYLLGDDESAWKLQTPQRDLVQERQGFLKAAAVTEEKQAKEAALDHDYKLAHARHQAALSHFIGSAYGAHEGRGKLRTLINGAGMKLCKPSDVLDDAGGLLNPAAAETMPVVPDPTVTDDYKDAVKAFNLLKAALKV